MYVCVPLYVQVVSYSIVSSCVLRVMVRKYKQNKRRECNSSCQVVFERKAGVEYPPAGRSGAVEIALKNRAEKVWYDIPASCECHKIVQYVKKEGTYKNFQSTSIVSGERVLCWQQRLQ